jgi:hypothetical protein
MVKQYRIKRTITALSAAVLTWYSSELAVEAVLLPVVSVIASGHDGNPPINTLDGTLATRWSAYGEGQWILYDLGSSQEIHSVDISWYQGNRRRAYFDVQTSNRGYAWTTVFSGQSSGLTLGHESYDVTDSTGQFVRIVGHGNSITPWNSLNEVRINGLASSTPPPALGEIPSPSDILDLSDWKLTLPVDTAQSGNPDEYLQPELNSGFHSQFFHVNDTLDGVVFKAPCGGATTSGSGYPRSELREMSNLGLTQASWSTTSGTHTLEITQTINHLPVAKPHVVVGQIHDANDDVIVFRLEGSTLFIDENGKAGPVLTADYRLGDVFTVRFVARNGGVECYYNSQYIYTYPVNASGCYFKAGCYTQSNTSKGDAADAYGEVVIYELTVAHQ